MNKKTKRVEENREKRPYAVAKYVRVSPYKVRTVSYTHLEEIRFEGFSFFPKHFTFATFGEVLSNTKSAPVLQWFVNSFIVSVSSAILILFIDSMRCV